MTHVISWISFILEMILSALFVLIYHVWLVLCEYFPHRQKEDDKKNQWYLFCSLKLSCAYVYSSSMAYKKIIKINLHLYSHQVPLKNRVTIDAVHTQLFYKPFKKSGVQTILFLCKEGINFFALKQIFISILYLDKSTLKKIKAPIQEGTYYNS